MLPVVMSIAGSDSSGGAGIQADLKTFHAFGCFGTTAITAITAQNTTGVSHIQDIWPEVVAAQIEDVINDMNVGAAKTGMLLSVEIMNAIQKAWLQSGNGIPLVVDPVMVASSGARLLNQDAVDALIQFISSVSVTLLTPNLPEAEILLGHEITDRQSALDAARALSSKFQTSILLKGGHRLSEKDQHNDEVYDILYIQANQTTEVIKGPRLNSNHTHGTGCTLSAAIAAGLARKKKLDVAVQEAREYLMLAMKHAPQLGKGTGPLNHMPETWSS